MIPQNVEFLEPFLRFVTNQNEHNDTNRVIEDDYLNYLRGLKQHSQLLT